MFLKTQVNPSSWKIILNLKNEAFFPPSQFSSSVSTFSRFRYTVDFVKQNGLEIGDSLTLYEDESKNLVSLSTLLLLAIYETVLINWNLFDN